MQSQRDLYHNLFLARYRQQREDAQTGPRLADPEPLFGAGNLHQPPPRSGLVPLREGQGPAPALPPVSEAGGGVAGVLGGEQDAELRAGREAQQAGVCQTFGGRLPLVRDAETEQVIPEVIAEAE